MSPIEISYRPELRDVLHAARIAEGSMWKNGSRVAAALLGLSAGFFFYAGYFLAGVLFLGLAVAEGFNLLPLSVVVAYLEFKRNPKYKQQYKLTLLPEALSFETDSISTTLKWSHYNRFWETNRAFVLSYGAGIPTVIPKAAFSSDVQRNDARILLERAIGKREAA